MALPFLGGLSAGENAPKMRIGFYAGNICTLIAVIIDSLQLFFVFLFGAGLAGSFSLVGAPLGLPIAAFAAFGSFYLTCFAYLGFLFYFIAAKVHFLRGKHAFPRLMALMWSFAIEISVILSGVYALTIAVKKIIATSREEDLEAANRPEKYPSEGK